MRIALQKPVYPDVFQPLQLQASGEGLEKNEIKVQAASFQIRLK